ncbi:hypothetical protein A6A08_14815 [Nocardiopsis sp. TSRI0078]|uniref:hypothetical protein n=1 Tax=unclassified Nocardiopsis TaxID=2649073 RepID=UPI00093DF7C4|nr:hypothetical protein [Nocardiopsis sp. TSRI0078]OKI13557.1 hypothetical protein A6A08_14815 [Nocardiopsis sp. TSRI0078]
MPFFPRDSRLSLTPVASLTLVLALSACGGEEPAQASAPSEETAEDTAAEGGPADQLSQEELAGLLVEKPVPSSRPQMDESALPPEPEDSAPLPERVAWLLLAEVSRKASHVAPGSAAVCPERMEEVAGRSYTCTLSYGGLDMRFPALAEDGGGGVGFRFEYPELPTVRGVVEDTIRFDHGVEEVYCDMDDVVAVVPGADRAPYLCYAADGGDASVEDSPDAAITPYEVYVLVGGTLATYPYLSGE